MNRSHSIASAVALACCLTGASLCLAAPTHLEGGTTTKQSKQTRGTTHAATQTSQSSKNYRGAARSAGTHMAPMVSNHAAPARTVRAQPMVQHRAAQPATVARPARHATVRTPVAHAKANTTHAATVTHTARSMTRPVSTTRTAHGATRMSPPMHPAALPHPFVKHVVAVRHVESFSPGQRVFGRVTSVNGSKVTVRLPNGSTRTFVSSSRPGVGSRVVAFANGDRAERFENEGSFFRTAEADPRHWTFRLANGTTQTFNVVRISQPVANRMVFFVDQPVAMTPVTFLQSAAFDQNTVDFIQPNGFLLPLGVTGIQLLPGGQLAFFTDQSLAQSYYAPTVSFVGQVVGVNGDMVAFATPDGNVVTLVDPGALPPLGANVVVYENGNQVVGLQPAVTTFQGQVVAVNNNDTTFLMPDGTMRTLVYNQPAPVVGTRVTVSENGLTVERIAPIF
ncbi:MAG: hypothetical protein JO194_11405 [Candidatus Eremiobacteraeota bacterium]|nr:hypothetical protein [Candidatus Eremiobacteraeota bacterium]